MKAETLFKQIKHRKRPRVKRLTLNPDVCHHMQQHKKIIIKKDALSMCPSFILPSLSEAHIKECKANTCRVLYSL